MDNLSAHKGERRIREPIRARLRARLLAPLLPGPEPHRRGVLKGQGTLAAGRGAHPRGAGGGYLELHSGKWIEWTGEGPDAGVPEQIVEVVQARPRTRQIPIGAGVLIVLVVCLAVASRVAAGIAALVFLVALIALIIRLVRPRRIGQWAIDPYRGAGCVFDLLGPSSVIYGPTEERQGCLAQNAS
jgi:hypothetical protein